jgi:DNA-binding MarR family transcriptional regulator
MLRHKQSTLHRRRQVDDRTELVDALVTASRVLVSVAVRSIAAAEPEVTIAQHRILVLLAARGPQRIGDLAVELNVNSSNATRHCDRLQRAGLVDRQRSVQDGRAVCVSLTDAGRDRLERVTTTRSAEIAAILDAMPPEHHENLVTALRAFGDAAGELSDNEWAVSARKAPA